MKKLANEKAPLIRLTNTISRTKGVKCIPIKYFDQYTSEVYHGLE